MPVAPPTGQAAQLDPEDPFCPAIAGIHPHDFHPYFDLRTLSTFLFCSACGEQRLVLPDTQSQVSPQNFTQINNGVQPSVQPAPTQKSPIFNNPWMPIWAGGLDIVARDVLEKRA